MTPEVSIIVPVYNAEQALRRCVDSILKQNFRDFELLLMDDGSTDSSPMICDEYEKTDERVTVIHKKNSGVSDTRNQALNIAKGKYVQFVDSDDWITPESTGMMVRSMEESKAEMVIADFYRVVEERVSQRGAIDTNRLMTRNEFALELLQKPSDFYYGVLWNKLFDRSIIEKFGVRMDPNISWSEDFIFNLQYIEHCNTIYALKVPVYYYVKTKGSLATNITLRASVEMKQLVYPYYDAFFKNIFSEEEYEKHHLQIYRFLIDFASDGLMFPAFFPGNYKLGKERVQISEDAKVRTGYLFDIYRDLKLKEKMLDIVALQNDLTLYEVEMICYLMQSDGYCNSEDAAEILSLSRTNVYTILRHLQSLEILERENVQEEIGKTFTFTSNADSILSEIRFILDECENMEFMDFTEEEKELYRKLSRKRTENIKKVL